MSTSYLLKLFRTYSGTLPFAEWFTTLRDDRAKQVILARLARVRAGNLGRTRSVGSGVHEFIIDFGPGYRVYFGQLGKELIIILCGGGKRTQNDDITKAKNYWTEYKKERRDVDYRL